MKIIIIGGTGHIGTYLVPRLLKLGHEVFQISRSKQKPYFESKIWKEVQHVVLDRNSTDSFTKKLRELRPDIVIDNICFTAEDAKILIKALSGYVGHLIVTGSIWVHSYSKEIPTFESANRLPLCDYGMNKNKMEKVFLEAFRSNNFPVTILHPGHIVGCGWPCLNPQGNFNLSVFQAILNGDTTLLPNLGLESVHHIHADDLSLLFQLSIEKPSSSTGEAFHAVSPQAITLRSYAEAVYSWFKKEPKIKFLPLNQMEEYSITEDFHMTVEHVERSPCMSLAKAQNLLDFKPRYSSLEACRESVDWMIENQYLNR